MTSTSERRRYGRTGKRKMSHWGDLLTALERVRAFARDDLSEQEMRTVEKVIHEVGRLVDRRVGGQ